MSAEQEVILPPAWEFTDSGLIILPGVSFEEWSELWTTVRGIHKKSLWYLGDCLAVGEERFGDEFAQVVDGYAPETTAAALRVSRAFPMATRRVALSWSVHHELVSLPQEVREELLERAEAEGWSSRRAREAKVALRTQKNRRLFLPAPDDAEDIGAADIEPTETSDTVEPLEDETHFEPAVAVVALNEEPAPVEPVEDAPIDVGTAILAAFPPSWHALVRITTSAGADGQIKWRVEAQKFGQRLALGIDVDLAAALATAGTAAAESDRLAAEARQRAAERAAEPPPPPSPVADDALTAAYNQLGETKRERMRDWIMRGAVLGEPAPGGTDCFIAAWRAAAAADQARFRAALVKAV